MDFLKPLNDENLYDIRITDDYYDKENPDDNPTIGYFALLNKKLFIDEQSNLTPEQEALVNRHTKTVHRVKASVDAKKDELSSLQEQITNKRDEVNEAIKKINDAVKGHSAPSYTQSELLQGRISKKKELYKTLQEKFKINPNFNNSYKHVSDISSMQEYESFDFWRSVEANLSLDSQAAILEHLTKTNIQAGDDKREATKNQGDYYRGKLVRKVINKSKSIYDAHKQIDNDKEQAQRDFKKSTEEKNKDTLTEIVKLMKEKSQQIDEYFDSLSTNDSNIQNSQNSEKNNLKNVVKNLKKETSDLEQSYREKNEELTHLQKSLSNVEQEINNIKKSGDSFSMIDTKKLKTLLTLLTDMQTYGTKHIEDGVDPYGDLKDSEHSKMKKVYSLIEESFKDIILTDNNFDGVDKTVTVNRDNENVVDLFIMEKYNVLFSFVYEGEHPKLVWSVPTWMTTITQSINNPNLKISDAITSLIANSELKSYEEAKKVMELENPYVKASIEHLQEKNPILKNVKLPHEWVHDITPFHKLSNGDRQNLITYLSMVMQIQYYMSLQNNIANSLFMINIINHQILGLSPENSLFVFEKENGSIINLDLTVPVTGFKGAHAHYFDYILKHYNAFKYGNEIIKINKDAKIKDKGSASENTKDKIEYFLKSNSYLEYKEYITKAFSPYTTKDAQVAAFDMLPIFTSRKSHQIIDNITFAFLRMFEDNISAQSKDMNGKAFFERFYSQLNPDEKTSFNEFSSYLKETLTTDKILKIREALMEMTGEILPEFNKDIFIDTALSQDELKIDDTDARDR